MWDVDDVGRLSVEEPGTRTETTLDLHWENTEGVIKIIDVVPQRFPYLQHLNLEGQRVADVGPLGLLLSLRELMISGNQLVDVAPLSSCLLLTKVDLCDNMIAEIPGMRFILANLYGGMLVYLGVAHLLHVQGIFAAW